MVSTFSKAPCCDRCLGEVSPTGPHHVGKGVSLPLGLFLFCHSVQFSSVAQSCPTLCDPMNVNRCRI